MFRLPSPKYGSPHPSSFKLQVLLIHAREETKKLINLEQISKHAPSGLETRDRTSQGAAFLLTGTKHCKESQASGLPCIEALDECLRPAVPATTVPPAPWDRAARLVRRGNFSL